MNIVCYGYNWHTMQAITAVRLTHVMLITFVELRH